MSNLAIDIATENAIIAAAARTRTRPLGKLPVAELPSREAAEQAVSTLLSFLGENVCREGVRETPKRFVKALEELTRGLRLPDPREHLRKSFTLADTEENEGVVYDGMILSRAIPFVSLCEHHLLPFTGKAYIGYIPEVGGTVVGLSKLARLMIDYAAQPQVQERLTAQVAKAIQDEVAPRGVGVVIEAKHTCQCLRGVRADGSMITSALYGVMKSDPATRSEFMSLCRLG